MAAFRPWANLPTELLLSITDGLDLPFQSYCTIRGVCAAWRAALPPSTPALISVAAIPEPEAPPVEQFQRLFARRVPKSEQVHALSLAAGRSFPLATVRAGGQCLGASGGWMAVETHSKGLFLLNPNGGENKVKFLLPRWTGATPVSKIVFPPSPTPDDHVVAICDLRMLAYTTAATSARNNATWTAVDVAVATSDYLVDLAYAADRRTVYCVTMCGDVRVVDFARPCQRGRPLVVVPLHHHHQGAERAGDLDLLLFDQSAVYAPPLDTASKVTGYKRIFFVGDGLYQFWRNTSSAVSWKAPGGGRFRVEKDEVFVLKYDSARRPCWHEVKDLGGCAVFIGKNSPAVVRAAGDVPGVRADCVYWIDEWSRNEPMVFDMATGTSRLHPAAISVPSPRSRTACWYVTNDNNTSISSNGRKRPLSGEDCGEALKIQKTSVG